MHFTLVLCSLNVPLTLVPQRARTAKKIETPADIEGLPDMLDQEKEEIKKLVAEFDVPKSAAKPGKGKKVGKGAAASKAAGSGSTTQTTLLTATKPSTSGLTYLIPVYH